MLKTNIVQVITGAHKRKKLVTPRPLYGIKTEPASSRIKSAIFSILQPHINKNTQVLDLYAGSGQLGIEAISRGADHTTFVDISQNAIDSIKQNLNSLDLLTKAQVFKANAVTFLTAPPLKVREQKFDIIFADPPFDRTKQRAYYEIVHLAKHLLAPGGIIIIRHPERLRLENREEELILADSRKYGSNRVSFFVLPFKNA